MFKLEEQWSKTEHRRNRVYFSEVAEIRQHM